MSPMLDLSSYRQASPQHQGRGRNSNIMYKARVEDLACVAFRGDWSGIDCKYTLAIASGQTMAHTGRDEVRLTFDSATLWIFEVAHCAWQCYEMPCY